MKVGDKIPVVLQVIRPVAHGESIVSGNSLIEVSNVRGDKFWAAPIGTRDGPYYMVCSDGDTGSNIIRRLAIVDLIETGPC